MNRLDERLETPWIALKIAYGLVPLLAGFDRFFNVLASWPSYVSPAVAGLLPFGAQGLMYVVGVIEIAVGIAILTRWTVLASYVAAAWLLLIAVNLVAAGYFDVAVRDVVMAIGAFTLARLTEARGSSAVRRHDAAGLRHAA